MVVDAGALGGVSCIRSTHCSIQVSLCKDDRRCSQQWSIAGGLCHIRSNSSWWPAYATPFSPRPGRAPGYITGFRKFTRRQASASWRLPPAPPTTLPASAMMRFSNLQSRSAANAHSLMSCICNTSTAVPSEPLGMYRAVSATASSRNHHQHYNASILTPCGIQSLLVMCPHGCTNP